MRTYFQRANLGVIIERARICIVVLKCKGNCEADDVGKQICFLELVVMVTMAPGEWRSASGTEEY
jgi:hypothetical protein